MTNDEKQIIKKLRAEGLGYKSIAAVLKIPVGTVRSFCRREGFDGLIREIKELPCLWCGSPVVQNPKRKQKKFCSDKCRYKWWNAHPEKLNKCSDSFHKHNCKCCGKEFVHYGRTNGKYCSHECYIKDRFNGGRTYED